MSEFTVEQHEFKPGAEEGQQPDPNGAGAGFTGPESVEGEICWSPEQAQAVLAALWNVGCLFYGFEWAAQQGEFAGWSDAAANLLNRYVPFGAGDGTSLVLDLIRAAGGVSMMAIRRKELIRQGPVILRKRDAGEQKAKPAPAEGEQPQPGPQAPPPPQQPRGSTAGFQFTEEQLRVIQSAQREPMPGHGYGDVA